MRMQSALVLYSRSNNIIMAEPGCPGDGEEHAPSGTIVSAKSR